MRVRNNLIVSLLAVLLIVPLTSCQKNEQESERFPRADDQGFTRSYTEMISFKLANGATIYLQEDTTYDQVAIELFYRAGFCHEPAGKAQVAHLAEHAVVFSPTASFGARGAVGSIGAGGKVAAEATGEFVHFDWVVQSNRLEDVIKMASEQLTSVQFDEDVRVEEAKRAAKEITSVLASERASLTKFGMMTVLQAIQHGESFVPIMQNNYDLTTEDLAAFHEERYRPNDMVLIIVGNFTLDEGRALVEKYFGGIPAKPEPPQYQVNLPGDQKVRWDIDAEAAYLIYPGPFEDERERAALVAFGAYLHQYIARDPEMPVIARSTYSTNATYPLNNLPFFVFMQPETYRSTAELVTRVSALMDQALETLDEVMFTRIISTLQNLVGRSFLEAEKDNYQIENHIVIGQHALNVGLKHYLRNGRSVEEYNEMLASITFEEMKQILQKYLSQDQRRVVTISRH